MAPTGRSAATRFPSRGASRVPRNRSGVPPQFADRRPKQPASLRCEFQLQAENEIEARNDAGRRLPDGQSQSSKSDAREGAGKAPRDNGSRASEAGDSLRACRLRSHTARRKIYPANEWGKDAAI